MSDSYIKFKFKDVEHEILTRDVTNQRLRQMKQWFGPEYGSFNGFPRLLIQLDADAWACALWIAQQLAGAKVIEDPREMDFSMDDLELLVNEPEDAESDPTEDVDTSLQTPDSTVTA
jgi:hypothetical protein